MYKKVLIIPKLSLHKMYKKPKSVWLFMQSNEKFRGDENQKIGLNTGLLLRNAKKCQGYVFEIKCPHIAQIHATLTTATRYLQFRSNATSKIDFLTLFTTVFAHWVQYWKRIGARKNSFYQLKCQKIRLQHHLSPSSPNLTKNIHERFICI